jgi:hypothetical protein
MVLAVVKETDKETAINRLHEMGLDQIANWIQVLPEGTWEERFLSTWPTLAKKCGLRRD